MQNDKLGLDFSALVWAAEVFFWVGVGHDLIGVETAFSSDHPALMRVRTRVALPPNFNDQSLWQRVSPL